MDEKVNLQKTFGEYLEKLGHRVKNLVVLDNDLSNHLNTLKFAKSFPEKLIHSPLSSTNMLNQAAGITSRGKIAICCGNASSIIGKGWHTIKSNLCHNNLNIKLIGSNSGLSNSQNGVHNEMTEDIALLTSLPEITVYSPADAIEMKAMMDKMINEFGVFYLRLAKNTVTNIYEYNHQFDFTKPDIIKSGEEICFLTYGSALHNAMEAASELEKRGTSVQIINVSSIKPLNKTKILEMTADFPLIVTIEEHTIMGGLGDQIINIYNQNKPRKILKIGTTETLVSGKYQEVLEKHQLTPKGIYEQVKNAWLEN
ncbi:hypothetical protein GF376_01130 [Candidatus Peregrinibacteria bacterium]|nr:hypothetical protein [Candidatus Peregrinibacteria bacterium]